MTHPDHDQLERAAAAARALVDDNMRQVEQVLLDALQPIGLRAIIGRPPMLLVADLPATPPAAPVVDPEHREWSEWKRQAPCSCPPGTEPGTIVGCPRHERERVARELRMLPQCAACGVTGQPMQPNGTCADDAACCSRIVERANEGVHTS